VAAVVAEAHLHRWLQGAPPRGPLPELEHALSRAGSGLRASLGARRQDVSWPVWLTWLVRVELAALRYRTALGQARWEDAGAVLAPLGQPGAASPEEDPRLDEVIARAHEARAELGEQLGRR
jgi:hypothetical protein